MAVCINQTTPQGIIKEAQISSIDTLHLGAQLLIEKTRVGRTAAFREQGTQVIAIAPPER